MAMSLVLPGSTRTIFSSSSCIFRQVYLTPTTLLNRNYSSSSSATTSKDDSHPHLYYHTLPNNGKLALSYLSKTSDGYEDGGSGVIGWLPNTMNAGLADFKANPKFLPIMHSGILEAIKLKKAPTVETEAMMRGSDGFMHLCDERNLPPAGRIPDPEDIIASIYVQDGKVVPETYEAQPMYRLCTGDGVCVLPYGIDQHVMQMLQAAQVEEEKK